MLLIPRLAAAAQRRATDEVGRGTSVTAIAGTARPIAKPAIAARAESKIAVSDTARVSDRVAVARRRPAPAANRRRADSSPKAVSICAWDMAPTAAAPTARP